MEVEEKLAMESFPYWVVAVLALTAVLNTVVPFAGGSVIVPILALVTDPHQAIALATVFYIMMNIPRIYLFRKTIQWNHVRDLLPVSLIGAGFGAFAIIQIEPKILLGVVFVFTLYFLYKKIKQVAGPAQPASEKKSSPLSSAGIGAFSGFLQGTGLSGSDLRNGYLYSKGVTIKEIHGTTAIIGTGNFLLATLLRLGTNQVALPDLFPILLLLPFTILGTLAGKYILFRLNARTADWIVVAVMAGAALLLIPEII